VQSRLVLTVYCKARRCEAKAEIEKLRRFILSGIPVKLYRKPCKNKLFYHDTEAMRTLKRGVIIYSTGCEHVQCASISF